jgi:hypothetical protein
MPEGQINFRPNICQEKNHMTIDEAFNASVAFIWNRNASTGAQPMTARHCWEISCNG